MIDLTRHEIFVDADTLISGPAASGGVEASHRLFGLDLFTGKVELDEPAMPNAGEDQLAQLQRPGLALDKGYVVIAYGQNTGDCPGPNGPAHGYVVSIPETGGPLHYFQIGSGRDRGAVWMGGSSPVVDPHGNIYVASADGYDLGAGQSYDDSDAVLELSPHMHLESIFYPKDWQTLSADDLDLGTGDPVLVDGFVFQIGKTDIAYLLRQGHLGGEEGEVASLSMCSGDPDGGHAVEGSVVYVPCPNGVTAVKVSTKPPYLKQTLDRQRRRGWRDRSSPTGWSGRSAATPCTASTRPMATRSSRYPSADTRTTSRRLRLAMACCSFPVPTRSSPSWVRPDCRRRLPLSRRQWIGRLGPHMTLVVPGRSRPRCDTAGPKSDHDVLLSGTPKKDVGASVSVLGNESTEHCQDCGGQSVSLRQRQPGRFLHTDSRAEGRDHPGCGIGIDKTGHRVTYAGVPLQVEAAETCRDVGIVTRRRRRVDLEKTGVAAGLVVDQRSPELEAGAGLDEVSRPIALDDLPADHLDEELAL